MYKTKKKLKVFPHGIGVNENLESILSKIVKGKNVSFKMEGMNALVSGIYQEDETTLNEEKGIMEPVTIKKPFEFKLRMSDDKLFMFMETDSSYGGKGFTELMKHTKGMSAKKIMLEKGDVSEFRAISGSNDQAKKMSASDILDLNLPDMFHSITKMKFPLGDGIITLNKSGYTFESNEEPDEDRINEIENEIIPMYVRGNL